MNKELRYDKSSIELLENCNLCPRNCRINRFKGGRGYCGIDAGLNIASFGIHRGEEPSINGISGIFNIFFAGCNLRCVYCQNYEISRRFTEKRNARMEMKDILDEIEIILSKGVKSVGFVSPSHVVPQVKAILNGIWSRKMRPVIVYNTGGYDKPEIIRSLSGLIDVYLPDYKYCTTEISSKYSDASDYPKIAIAALKEMYYQKGSTLIVNDDGMAENGLIIRHLVLPGHSDESKKVLRSIAEELSPGVHISLMSQYYPTPFVSNHPTLGRSLYKEEYESVVEEMKTLGFRHGWIQDMDSFQNFRPDFRRKNPFE